MKIRWLRKRDKLLYTDLRRATSELGRRAALTYKEIVETIEFADDFRNLIESRPYGMHRLTRDRRNQWAMRLSRGLRLIVQPDSTYSVTIIVEIVDYHRRRRR